jgi:hypothetical protein
MRLTSLRFAPVILTWIDGALQSLHFGFVLGDVQRHLNSGLLLAQFVRVSLKQTQSQQTKIALAA